MFKIVDELVENTGSSATISFPTPPPTPPKKQPECPLKLRSGSLSEICLSCYFVLCGRWCSDVEKHFPLQKNGPQNVTFSIF